MSSLAPVLLLRMSLGCRSAFLFRLLLASLLICGNNKISLLTVLSGGMEFLGRQVERSRSSRRRRRRSRRVRHFSDQRRHRAPQEVDGRWAEEVEEAATVTESALM